MLIVVGKITSDLKLSGNTSHLSKNCEGSLVYNDEIMLLPDLNKSINLNSKGAIYNFPKVENNVTGGSRYLLNSTDSSYVTWTYQLINNGDVTSWDDIPANKLYSKIDNSNIIFITNTEYTENLKTSTKDFIFLIKPIDTTR